MHADRTFCTRHRDLPGSPGPVLVRTTLGPNARSERVGMSPTTHPGSGCSLGLLWAVWCGCLPSVRASPHDVGGYALREFQASRFGLKLRKVPKDSISAVVAILNELLICGVAV